MEFVFSEGTLDEQGWVETVVVPPSLRYLEGHFPGDPIVPGVAQVVALGEERARHAWPDLGASEGLRRLKFMDALRANHELALRLIRKDGDPTKVTFTIHRNDTLCSKGTLLFRPPR